MLTGEEVNERFPGYELPKDYCAVYQEDGGFVVPEQAITGHVTAAQARGAEIHAREYVKDWKRQLMVAFAFEPLRESMSLTRLYSQQELGITSLLQNWKCSPSRSGRC
ncbi:hypothetical protein [Halorubrum laminariae]|uniref:Uncharacterized protein n=1 Tax=Halorubrum laminariae TaxID=1433523 RepID=A0ABD6C2K7_9EURY